MNIISNLVVLLAVGLVSVSAQQEWLPFIQTHFNELLNLLQTPFVGNADVAPIQQNYFNNIDPSGFPGAVVKEQTQLPNRQPPRAMPSRTQPQFSPSVVSVNPAMIRIRPSPTQPTTKQPYFLPKVTTEKPQKDKLQTQQTTKTTTVLPPIPTFTGVPECESTNNCTTLLKSFDTSHALFQYAYSQSHKIEGTARKVFEDTQAIPLPRPLEWSNTIAPETVHLSQLLIKLYKPRNALVVGIFTGVGLIGVAEAMGASGTVLGLEYPEYYQYYNEVGASKAGKRNMAKIETRRRVSIPQALTDLTLQTATQYDFILLNDQRQVNYEADYEKCLTLLRSGGLMIVADALADGAVLNLNKPDSPGAAITKFNRDVARDVRVDASLLPFGGGTTIILKK